MTRKRTPDEQREYQRVYRARKKAELGGIVKQSHQDGSTRVIDELELKEVSLVEDPRYVLVRRYSGGVFADGTTNTPPIDLEEPVYPSEAWASLPEFRSNVGGPVPKPSAKKR